MSQGKNEKYHRGRMKLPQATNEKYTVGGNETNLGRNEIVNDNVLAMK